MKHRFDVLDIFRGIFASMVVFFHLSAFSDTPVLNNSFIYNSDLFVDFFFVLSGFVICYTYQSVHSAQALTLFYKKRFLRLYPLHVVMLLLFVVVEAAKKVFAGHIHINQPDNLNNNVLTFFSNLLFLHSVKLPGVTDVSWNIPSWSISAEMIAYLLFGIVVYMIHRLQLIKIKNLIYLFITFISLYILLLITGNGKLTYSFDYGFLRAIIGFFLGVLCFNTFSFTRRFLLTLPHSFFHIAEIGILCLLIVLVSEGSIFKPFGFIYEIVFFFAVLIFAFEKGILSVTLKRYVILQKLGKYSYSIYMTHALLISLFNILFIRLLKLPPSAYLWLFLLNYYLIYKVSEWTFTNIEMRFNHKKNARAL